MIRAVRREQRFRRLSRYFMYASGAFAIAWLAAAYWQPRLVFSRSAIGADRSGLWLHSWNSSLADPDLPPAGRPGVEWWLLPRLDGSRWTAYRSGIRFSGSSWGFSIPSAPLLMLMLFASGYYTWLARRALRRFGCSECGYDLTSNVTGRCPECGAIFNQSLAAAAAPAQNKQPAE